VAEWRKVCQCVDVFDLPISRLMDLLLANLRVDGHEPSDRPSFMTLVQPPGAPPESMCSPKPNMNTFGFGNCIERWSRAGKGGCCEVHCVLRVSVEGPVSEGKYCSGLQGNFTFRRNVPSRGLGTASGLGCLSRRTRLPQSCSTRNLRQGS
jgi:hypothetical protein